MSLSSNLYGLIGYPVKHSFSPVMHNSAFKSLKINAEYRLFEIKPEELQDFLTNPDKKVQDVKGNSVWAKDVLGFNITIPHKIKAKRILSSDPKFINEKPYHVTLSGAVNTVKRDGSILSYWNTDPYGFMTALEKDLNFIPKGRERALIIGCGGAGRAAISGLSEGGEGSGVEKIYVYEKDEDMIRSAEEHFSECLSDYPYLEGKIEFISFSEITEKIRDCHLLVNASPVGMRDDSDAVIDRKALAGNKNLCVYDVVYNRRTRLICDAKDLGLPAAGGRSMLLYQGVAALKIWLNQEVPVEIMKQALDEEINKLC